MSARIVQVDLARPLASIACDRAGAVLYLLVRFGLQPLGWVKCAAASGTLGADQISQLVSQSLALRVHDAARLRLFESRHACKPDVVLALGADAVVDEHFHNALADSYADPAVQCVIGDLWPASVSDAAEVEFARVAFAHSFEPRKYTPRSWNALFTKKPDRSRPEMALSVRREIFTALGGFDPALRGGAAGADLVTRILRAGGTVVRDPRALCLRRGRPPRQSFRETSNYAAYCAKYFNDPEVANRSFKAWRSMISGSLAALDFSGAAGAILGLREYRRALRRLHKQRARMTA